MSHPHPFTSFALIVALVFLAGMLAGIGHADRDGACLAAYPACLIVAGFNGWCLWRRERGYA